MAKKYYKTEFKLIILSEEDISNIDLEDIAREVNETSVLHTFDVSSVQELTPKEAADNLIDAGSQPEFFRLDKDGNSVDI
jgi:hypothetical protein